MLASSGYSVDFGLHAFSAYGIVLCYSVWFGGRGRAFPTAINFKYGLGVLVQLHSGRADN